jgi:SAM-dependent methyltransferase
MPSGSESAMHASALENLARCRDRYVTSAFLEWRVRTRILCVGVGDGPGSCRPLFSFPGARYTAADLRGGAGIDVVLDDPDRIPFADGRFHIVIGGPLLGRSEPFARHLGELLRVLHPRGLLFVVAPSCSLGPRDADEARSLTPDVLDDLARQADVLLIERWIDRRGPSRDIVGVFAKRSAAARVQAAPARRPFRLARVPLATLTPANPTPPRRLSARLRRIARRPLPAGNAERSAPAPAGRPDRVRYTVVLEELHRVLEPRLYVEIGVRHGRSLRLARSRAIGIDPAATVSDPLPPTCTVVAATSDAFFEATAERLIDTAVELSFIDGVHLFEYALRDFMNLERWAAPAGIVVFDDVFPNHPAEAERICQSGIWMGDVWKMACILREYRPELTCVPVDVATGGLLLVGGLDPRNDVLWNRYNEIVERYSAPPFDEVPSDVLARTGALDPADPRIRQWLDRWRTLPDDGSSGRMS